MAPNPSYQEAQRLLALHQDFVHSLQAVRDRPQALLGKIGAFLSSPENEEAFGRAMMEDLEEGISPLEVPAVSSLLKNLYLYRKALPLSRTASEVLLPYESSLRMAEKSLKPLAHPLRWFFTFPGKKEEARKAYAYLEETAHGKIEDFLSLDQETLSACERELSQSLPAPTAEESEFFLNLLYREVSPCQGEKLPPACLSLLSSFRKGLEAYQKLDGLQKASLQRIEEAVQGFFDAQAEVFLSDIPVEELGRDQRGMRTGLLRDAGYLTVTDVLHASSYSLAAIKGISDDMAERMKDIARDYRETYKTNIPLRLPSENPGKEVLALARALYRHLQSVSPWEDAFAAFPAPEEGADSALENSSPCRNLCLWPLLSEETRGRAREAFRFMRDYPSGEILALAGSLPPASPVPGTEEAWEAFLKDPIPFYGLLERLYPDSQENALYGLPEDLAKQIQEEPLFLDGLHCTLRRYQEWGTKYILHQGRVLLGDEMGLGKTIQAIAAMVSLHNSGASRFLVICPASVLPNWCKEISQKSNVPLTKIHGADRLLQEEEWKRRGGAAVTTYEACQSLTLGEEMRLDLLVVDEAHYIKNPKAKRSSFVRDLCERADRLLFMTGTALENRVGEMISLLDVLQPAMAQQAKGVAFMATTDQFQQKIAQVYFRRKREEVLKELPDLIQMEEWCSLTPAEEIEYEKAIFSGNYADIRRVSWNAPSLADSSKAKRLLELCEEAAGEGRKILVFSFFLDTIKKVQELLGDKCSQPINGSLSPAKRQQVLDDFEKAPAGSVLLAQILAGGTGLNIQSASVVILCEPQFKPSVENQAISRAYRMGQARSVLVHRLLCENTVDEKLLELLSQKQAVFNAFADQSALSAAPGETETQVDEAGFGEIVKEERERLEKEGKKPQEA